jgi:hypothetical protein
MVAPFQSQYSNKKGIYKNLYQEIDSNNKKEKLSQTKRQPKGIYVELYRQIGFKSNDRKKDSKNLYLLALKKLVSDISNLFLKFSNFFVEATGEIKMLILACMVAKKPINSYIDNDLKTYQCSEQNLGNYYNDRRQ